MPVVVAVLRESAEGERRVALTPEVAKKLKARGAQIVIEKSAAASAYFADSAFADAEVVADGPAALAKADVLLRVQPPTVEEISHLKPGQVDLIMGEIAQCAALLKTLPRPLLMFCRSGARSTRLYQQAISLDD